MSSITSKIKNLETQRYYDERVLVRDALCKNLPVKGTVLELFSGKGEMTNVYKSYGFTDFIGVDKDIESSANYKQTAISFIEEELPKLGGKICIADFDHYGGPHFEIQKFFDIMKNRIDILGVVITDGLGLGMKRSQKLMKIEERFMLNENDLKFVNPRYAWNHHKKMTYLFMARLAKKYGFIVVPQSVVQGKGSNFVFSSWIFYS